MDPEEQQLKWRQANVQEALAQSQIQRNAAQTGMDQQKVNLMTQAQGVDMIQKGIEIQNAQLGLQTKTAGLDEWHGMVTDAGGDPDALYNRAPPTNPYALQQWQAGRGAWLTTQQGMAQQNHLAQMKEMGQKQLDSVNEAIQSQYVANLLDDGTPLSEINPVVFDQSGKPKLDAYGNTVYDPDKLSSLIGGYKQSLQEAAIKLRATPQIYRNQGLEAVAAERLAATKYASDTRAKWETDNAVIRAKNQVDVAKIKTGSDVDAFQNKLTIAAQKQFGDAAVARFKAIANAITLDPDLKTSTDKASAMNAAYDNLTEEERKNFSSAAAPAASTPAQGKAPVMRIAPDGRKVLYDPDTKQPIGYAE